MTSIRAIAVYFGWYLAGIAAAIALTPIGLMLLGVHIWPYYVALPIISFVFFYTLAPPYIAGGVVIYWLFFIGGIAFPVAGLATLRGPLRRWARFRPALIGLPFGFIGATGVYYSVAASI